MDKHATMHDTSSGQVTDDLISIILNGSCCYHYHHHYRVSLPSQHLHFWGYLTAVFFAGTVSADCMQGNVRFVEV